MQHVYNVMLHGMMWMRHHHFDLVDLSCVRMQTIFMSFASPCTVAADAGGCLML